MEIQKFKAEVKLNILEAKLLYTVYLQILNFSNNDAVKYEILEQINFLQKTINELSENLNNLGEIEKELLEKLNYKTVH
ncbi:MAG: hypothetical protein JM58_00360 [Peptococcaceae bacterium BICA1-8]|nr:MAG: hypothetical protein JM58_00360 [Peptococcaceae bacterium BICA1-8]